MHNAADACVAENLVRHKNLLRRQLPLGTRLTKVKPKSNFITELNEEICVYENKFQ